MSADPDGPLGGEVVSALATPDQVRLVVDVDDVGRVDAVASSDRAPRTRGAGAARRRPGPARGYPGGDDVGVVPRLTRVYRRAYTLLVGVAAVMGGLALVVSIRYDQPLLDPEGKFLGPSWARLPILLLLAIGIDLLPKAIWNSRGRPGSLMPAIRERLRTHWTRDRVTLVVLGVVCFYVTYVSYRNLKSALPFVIDTKYDRELHLLDKALFFGNDPSTVLHTVLGTGVSAHVLSYIYLWFLPLVPLALMAWLVWSRNLSYGYWFATSQCIAWSLGTALLLRAADPRPRPGVPPALHRPRAHANRRPDGVAGRGPTSDPHRRLRRIRRRGHRQLGRGLRQPALRDHPAGRADGAVHAAARGS